MLLTDALGTVHSQADGPCRIVSLVPSITELLWDLGLGDQLVGRTAFCVHPSRVREVESLGGTKDVDLDRLRELAPSHVVVNVDENRRETYQALREFVPNVIVTHPLAPRDNLELYRLMGGIFSRQAEAERLSAEFEAAWDRLLEATATLPRQRVVVLIWRKPWMTVCRDTYVSSSLALVGWDTEPAETPVRYPSFDAGAEWLRDVEVVLLATEPFPFKERHLEEAGRLVPSAAARLVDGEMISWYGSRAVPALDYLRTLRLTDSSGAGRI